MLLSDEPTWQYLIRDFIELYRAGSAGGSAKIRSHMVEVRTTLSKVLDDDPEVVQEEEVRLPVCVHLDRVLAGAAPFTTAKLASSLAGVRDHLVWQYGYEKVPRGLKQKFAFTEVLGNTGPIRSSRLKLGFVLFAPGTTYPAHSHKEIFESYINVSGHMSENDHGVFAPGSLIFNPPGHHHRITTADREPCLLAYAWTGDEEILANQKLSFSRK